jgi:hypothetical protein
MLTRALPAQHGRWSLELSRPSAAQLTAYPLSFLTQLPPSSTVLPFFLLISDRYLVFGARFYFEFSLVICIT